MSKAFPAGGPSKISVNTTSASSISTILCAVVDPTNPPPTTVTFFRLISISFGVRWLSHRFYGPNPSTQSQHHATKSKLSSRPEWPDFFLRAEFWRVGPWSGGTGAISQTQGAFSSLTLLRDLCVELLILISPLPTPPYSQ